MRIFIGLDGGGTACRARAELEDGRSTPVLTGGAANVFSDFDGALSRISTLLREAQDAARMLCPESDAQPARVVLGLAGASESHAAKKLRSALPYPELSVRGDVDISLAGAFNDRDGIVMAVGTGSVLAMQRAGRMQRVGGYGFTLGDEASGAWMGREALRRALHVRDGLCPAGPLTDALWARFGSLPEVIGFAGSARPSDYAALAPLVLEHERAGCRIAAEILDTGCDYLLRAITRLQDGDSTLPVAPLGGLGPVLLDRIMARGGGHLTRAEPAGTALDGAIWMARNGAEPRETKT